MADAKIGRFYAILVFILVYICGLTGLAIIASTFDNFKGNTAKPAIFIGSLFIVALGTGGIKSNVSTFGADQFSDSSNPVSYKQTFFNWFYFAINLGALLSFTLIAYVQEQTLQVGLIIPAGLMGLSALLFLSGTRSYIRVPPQGSTIMKSFKIVYHAIVSPQPRTTMHSYSFLDRAKWATGSDGRFLFTTQEIEDVKDFSRIIPIQLMFIIYWMLYAQMSSVFYMQGLYLDLHVFNGFQIPVACLNLFDTAIILILVPIFERILYPFLKKRRIGFGMLKRIGLGILIMIFSMISAGFVEMYRLYLINIGESNTQTVANIEQVVSNLSVFVQIPQFALIGISEVLGSITGLEFAYDQAPDTMKSTTMAVFLITTGLGNYLGSLVVFTTNFVSDYFGDQWIKNEVNDGHLDYYFFLLAGLGVINLIGFILVGRRYQYKRESLKHR
eukprot:TRINITY_DN6325_c0_g1_i3.p1 TRINITY_DN6325_c0_g1~~TRINITY_DN6325_c0_g1_i3.p1  ORF type:complete len:444 (+),score=62.15 TRINITY_DN6325_c0_g1_i3:173-1504(+)